MQLAVAVSMARVAGKLLILQIVYFLHSSAYAQLDDFSSSGDNPTDFSSSGDNPIDPTQVDYEFGDDGDYEYPFPYDTEDVDICRHYPAGSCMQ